MLDVDHFKRFNDQFGHDAGDTVLRALGDLLKQSARDTDAFRYGGEEFLLLMPNMGIEQAAQRAEEIRLKIGALQIEHAGRELGAITASFGVATAPEHCAFTKLIRTADAALLLAKEAGRNRVLQTEARQARPSSPTRAAEHLIVAPTSSRSEDDQRKLVSNPVVLVQQIEIRPCLNLGMGQFLKTADCPTCGRPMVMALPPGGKGPRTLRCVECDPSSDDKTVGWLRSGLRPPMPAR
jgi:diguanylate cyclase (GGDEF)-like protein